MAGMPKAVPAEALFLPAQAGQRFGLFYPPAGETCRGALLYLPPFGDEMNKSRRMAALQARALAAAGYGVLMIDLYGCGDSSGEFAEARWNIWKQDVALGCRWLEARLAMPVTLWGLRLGATLALDYARDVAHPLRGMLLWQPVTNGRVFLTQFLRLLGARAMVSDGGGAKPAGTGELRTALLGGTMLEVAGYELSPELAAAIDALDVASMAPGACPVAWFETASSADRPLPPALTRLLDSWRAGGADVGLQRVLCAPFWATQEIEEAPALLDATVSVLSGFADELSRTGT